MTAGQGSLLPLRASRRPWKNSRASLSSDLAATFNLSCDMAGNNINNAYAQQGLTLPLTCASQTIAHLLAFHFHK